MVKGTQFVLMGMGLEKYYWVEIKEHKIFPVGTRFLVVADYNDGWLRCWRDGLFPGTWSNGTLLKLEHVSRVNV